MGLIQDGWCPYQKKETPCAEPAGGTPREEEGGRDRGTRPPAQELQGPPATRTGERPGQGLPHSLGGSQPCSHLDADPSASGTVRKYIFVVSSHTVYFVTPALANVCRRQERQVLAGPRRRASGSQTCTCNRTTRRAYYDPAGPHPRWLSPEVWRAARNVHF